MPPRQADSGGYSCRCVVKSHIAFTGWEARIHTYLPERAISLIVDIKRLFSPAVSLAGRGALSDLLSAVSANEGLALCLWYITGSIVT